MPTYRKLLDGTALGLSLLLMTAVAMRDAQAQDANGPSQATRESASATFDPARIAGPTTSRAITQQAGDIFDGPGPIAVGWTGAKKQIVVPAGRWVLLGAEDGPSAHVPPVSMTSMVLAKLPTAGAFRSFLLVRFNSRTGDNRSTWNDASACDTSWPSAPFSWQDTRLSVAQCVTSEIGTPSGAAKTWAGTSWKMAVQRISAGGGSLPSGSYLRTDMVYTGDFSNFLKISRFDFCITSTGAEASCSVEGQASSIDSYIAARRKWAEAYSALAALGYRKKLPDGELAAGSKPTMAATSLPD